MTELTRSQDTLQKTALEKTQEPPKLLIVIGSLMVGGTETFLVRILSKLAALGWKIEVFTLAYQRGELAQQLCDQGVRVTPIMTEKDQKTLARFPTMLERVIRIILCITRLSQRLRQENKNLEKNKTILHFYLPEAYILGMLSALLVRFQGPKGMSRRSMNHYQQKRPMLAWLEKKLHRYLDFATGNSKVVVDELQKEGIPLHKIKLIYNGLEIEDKVNPSSIAVKDEVRQALGIEKDALVFVIVANLISYKGHSDLLNAFALIKDKLNETIKRPWYLMCIGRDQGILKNLQHQAFDHQIDKNILWMGERKDVSKLLLAADVGILSSHEEGFSNAILECMAAGLPMVVTNVGGNAEAVLNNETGFVVPAKDPKSLSEALLSLASDNDRRVQFGQASRKRVIEHFTLQQCVDEHVLFYKTLTPIYS